MYNHNKAQQSKTVCIFLGIYCNLSLRHLQKCMTDNNIYSVTLSKTVDQYFRLQIYHLEISVQLLPAY